MQASASCTTPTANGFCHRSGKLEWRNEYEDCSYDTRCGRPLVCDSAASTMLSGPDLTKDGMACGTNLSCKSMQDLGTAVSCVWSLTSGFLNRVRIWEHLPVSRINGLRMRNVQPACYRTLWMCYRMLISFGLFYRKMHGAHFDHARQTAASCIVQQTGDRSSASSDQPPPDWWYLTSLSRSPRPACCAIR